MAAKNPSRRRRRRRRLRLDLKRSLFLLPNLITLSSVFCGLFSITESAAATQESDFVRAAMLIVFAMFFDLLDGRVARMTKTESAFGLQLDSLADVVSFGAAPALLVYQWSLSRLGLLGLGISFAFVACGAIRLARFNVLSMAESGAPTKPGKYIVGLPIPPAAGMLVALVVANQAAGSPAGGDAYVEVVASVTALLAFFMVSSIRFRSFKDLRLDLRSALLVGFTVATSVAIGVKLKPAFVLLWLLVMYVGMGIGEWLWHIPKRLRRTSREQPLHEQSGE